MAKYLDYTGLTYFKNKLVQQNNSTYVSQSEKGVASGIATLDSNAKIPSSQLPSYVDDVQEFANLSGFPVTGETDKIYLAIDTGNIYRWSGSQYVQIGGSVSTAESALKDGNGNVITTTYATKTENNAKLDSTSSGYIKGLSISGDIITYTKGDNTTGTLTLPASSTAITNSEIDALFV